MATISATWNTGNGEWFSSANWDEPNPNAPPQLLHYVPTADNDVFIPDNSSVGTPFSINYNGTSTVNSLNGAANARLSLTGGSLTILNGGVGLGTVDLAAGTTLGLSAGTFSFSNGSIAGTVSGAGTLRMINGTFEIDAGAQLTVDTWLITHQIGSGMVPTVRFNTDLTYAKTFLLLDVFGNYPDLALNGHTLTLSGTATIDGNVHEGGVLKITGTGEVLNAGFHDGAKLQIAKTATQAGTLGLDGTLQIDSGATYTFKAPSNIVIAPGENGAATVNNGAFAIEGGGISRINGSFINNGTLTIAAGTDLSLQTGSQTLNGTVGGGGRLVLGFAHDTTFNTSTLSVASILVAGGNGGGTATLAKDLGYAGTFTLDDTGVFDLDGHILTLSGTSSLARGTVEGEGTLRITGTATVGGGGVTFGSDLSSAEASNAVTFQNSGIVRQDGHVWVNGTILNDAGHSYTIVNATDIVGLTNGDAKGLTFINNGTFSDTASGRSVVSGNFTNAGGATLSVGAGAELALNAGRHELGGTLSGTGRLTFGFAHDATLNTSTLTVSSIYVNGGNGGGTLSLGKSLAYAKSFTFENAFGTLDLNGHELTLSGKTALNAGAIDGGGTLKITGTATIGSITVGEKSGGGGSAATLENAGSTTQTSYLFIRGTLLNDAGHTYTLAAANIESYQGGGNVTNNGTLSVITTPSHTDSIINATFKNAATLSIAGDATLRLNGTNTLEGKVTGAGHLIVAGTSTVSGTVTTGGLDFFGATTLGANFSFAKDFGIGTFSSTYLNGHTLKLAGTSHFDTGFNGIYGSGKLLITGKAFLNGVSLGAADKTLTLENAGAITQTGSISLRGSLINDAGHTYTLTAGNIDDASARITNSGIFVKSGDSGIASISAAMTNKGLLAVRSGTLTVGNLTNTGVIEGVIANNGSQYTITADTAGKVTLTGGSGNNMLDGTGGMATMKGGAGNDTYLVDSQKDKVVESGAASGGSADILKSSVDYVLTSGVGIEKMMTIDAAGKSAIDLTGNAYRQFITGNAGKNVLSGGGGADTLAGGGGADKLLGGAGIDTASYAGAKEGVTANLKTASANTNDAKGDTYKSIENLTGSSHDDRLTGDAAANTISGGSGNDTISGGLGKDMLIGGSGKDTFMFDTRLGPSNIDTIDDFSVKNDRIVLDNDIFTKAGKIGDLSSAAFHIGAKAHDKSDRIIYDSKSGKLYYDADGSDSGHAAVQFALLDKGLKLTFDHFDIIG